MGNRPVRLANLSWAMANTLPFRSSSMFPKSPTCLQKWSLFWKRVLLWITWITLLIFEFFLSFELDEYKNKKKSNVSLLVIQLCYKLLFFLQIPDQYKFCYQFILFTGVEFNVDLLVRVAGSSQSSTLFEITYKVCIEGILWTRFYLSLN